MKKHLLNISILAAVGLALLAVAAGRAQAKGPAASAYFPCKVTPLVNREFFPALVAAVDEARGEILISVFSFKAGVHKRSRPDILVEHLARAVERGVDVRVVLEDSSDPGSNVARQNAKTKNILEKRGVKVYMDEPARTTHTKLVVVDQRLVFVGSHNFTSSAFGHNNEITMMIEQSGLAEEVRAYILRLIREVK
jgi:HKD family nuclease